MTEQIAIPVPDSPVQLGPCAWCGKAAVGAVEVEPAKWGKPHRDSKSRILKKAAIEAPACREHIDIIEQQPNQIDPDMFGAE